MDTKAHANPYPDFCESPELFIKDESLKPSLTEKSDKLVELLIQELSEVLKNSSCSGEYSVYTGYLGIAMFLMQAAIKWHNSEIMNIVLEKCELAVENLKHKRICFLNGDAGPLALFAVISHLYGNKSTAKKISKKLIKLSQEVEKDKSLPDEMLYGRAGYMYALIFANKYLGDEIIEPKVIRTVAEKILQSGRCKSKFRKSCVPIEFEWHDKNYLGAAHGVAGILYILLLAHKLLTKYELNELIKPTVDWLLKNKRFPSGNFASSEGNGKDRLVQWCHGAPGFVHMLLQASEVFQEEKYKIAALKCGEVVWQRGLLTKGYSLCHGVSGNAYTFLQLYKVTKDLKYWHRAACFADWCTKYPQNQGLQPDRPYSLYEGKAGMGYFLLDYKNPSESIFPGFDV